MGNGTPTTTLKYQSKYDKDVKGFYNFCSKKGKIDSLPEVVGILLFMDGHMGVYIGNGEAIECTLGEYGDGVVKTKVKGRGWTHWGLCGDIEYIEEEKPTEKPKITMKVVPSVGLWLNDSNKRWNKSTHILLMDFGTTVEYLGEDKKLGKYTCCKVRFGNHTVGYCAKEYLKK